MSTILPPHAPEIMIRLSTGKTILLTFDELQEVLSMAPTRPFPTYAPMPMPPHNPLAPQPYQPTITC